MCVHISFDILAPIIIVEKLLCLWMTEETKRKKNDRNANDDDHDHDDDSYDKKSKEFFITRKRKAWSLKKSEVFWCSVGRFFWCHCCYYIFVLSSCMIKAQPNRFDHFAKKERKNWFWHELNYEKRLAKNDDLIKCAWTCVLWSKCHEKVEKKSKLIWCFSLCSI